MLDPPPTCYLPMDPVHVNIKSDPDQSGLLFGCDCHLLVISQQTELVSCSSNLKRSQTNSNMHIQPGEERGFVPAKEGTAYIYTAL